MELFTEVEFNKNEFGKVNEVRHKLSEEGWSEINERKHSVLKAGKRVLIAIKYKWMREI